MVNTITDDQGNKYELRSYFDHETQTDGYILVYLPIFQEGDTL